MSSTAKPSQTFVQIIKFHRITTIVCLIIAVVSLVYSNYSIATERAANNKRAYIITQTGTSVGEEIRGGDTELLQLEIKNHISTFAHCMWTFDQHSFWDQVQRGTEISTEPGKRIYLTYKEANFYEQLRAFDARSKLSIEKIEILDHTYVPYKARLYARHAFQVGDNIKWKWLTAYVELDETSRSDDNVHGFLVSTFNIENNSEIVK